MMISMDEHLCHRHGQGHDTASVQSNEPPYLHIQGASSWTTAFQWGLYREATSRGCRGLSSKGAQRHTLRQTGRVSVSPDTSYFVHLL